jgi:PIN domain nuclease of toxin-antitoxin system
VRSLLDTHTFFWFVWDDPHLSATARRIIEDENNEKLLSLASIWELAIKVGLGKLTLTEPLGVFVPREIAANSMTVLPISLDHAALLTTMPHHHRDPFDRMLLAQATIERLPILSADTAFDAYGVTRLW